MRLLKKTILALATLVLALAAFVAPTNNTKVEAANIPAGTVLYLRPNSNWKQSNARFAAYFFGTGNTNTWASMTLVEGETDIYQVNTPAGSWTNVIFCRMNPSATANNWNNGVKWNQTSDLVYDGTKNFYTVKENTWDKGGGTWAVYEPGIVAPEPEPEPEPEIGELKLGLVGTFNSWGESPDTAMTYIAEKERYEAEITFTAGDIFKIRLDNTWSKDWGWSNENNDPSLAKYCSDAQDMGNIKVNASGTYIVWIDSTTTHIGIEPVVEPWKLEVEVGYQIGTKDEAKALRLVAEFNLDAEMLETFDSTIQFRVTKGTKADTREVTRLYSSVNPMNDEAELTGAYYAVLTYVNIPAGEYLVEVLVDGVVAASVTATVA